MPAAWKERSQAPSHRAEGHSHSARAIRVKKLVVLLPQGLSAHVEVHHVAQRLLCSFNSLIRELNLLEEGAKGGERGSWALLSTASPVSRAIVRIVDPSQRLVLTGAARILTSLQDNTVGSASSRAQGPGPSAFFLSICCVSSRSTNHSAAASHPCPEKSQAAMRMSWLLKLPFCRRYRCLLAPNRPYPCFGILYKRYEIPTGKKVNCALIAFTPGLRRTSSECKSFCLACSCVN